MSDELWAWLQQVRVEREEAQVALQQGDDRPMKLWALLYGHLLIAKLEEMREALGGVVAHFKVETHYAYDYCTLCGHFEKPKPGWEDHEKRLGETISTIGKSA